MMLAAAEAADIAVVMDRLVGETYRGIPFKLFPVNLVVVSQTIRLRPIYTEQDILIGILIIETIMAMAGL